MLRERARKTELMKSQGTSLEKNSTDDMKGQKATLVKTYSCRSLFRFVFPQMVQEQFHLAAAITSRKFRRRAFPLALAGQSSDAKGNEKKQRRPRRERKRKKRETVQGDRRKKTRPYSPRTPDRPPLAACICNHVHALTNVLK